MLNNFTLIEQLSLIGLNKKQALVYIACLELGTTQVGAVAQKTGEKRTTVYAILQELVRQQLLKAIKSGNKYVFSPQEPITIVEQMEEKKDAVKKMIPSLNEKFLQKSTDPKLEIFFGKQITKLFDKILKSKEKQLFMIRSNADKSDVIGKEFHFGANRREVNIFAQVLLSRDTPKLEHDTQYFTNQKNKLREVRLLPGDITVTSDVFIFDNTVCIISPNEKFGFVIDNADFAHLQKNIFNLLWDVSKQTFNL